MTVKQQPLTLPAFIVMVDAAELVVPFGLPLRILRHNKQFQVIFQQTEAGSLYTKELPVLNEYATYMRYVKTTRRKLRRGKPHSGVYSGMKGQNSNQCRNT